MIDTTATTSSLACYGADHRIVSINKESRLARIAWSDGHVSEFHYLWLRDNCSCSLCRHPHTLERTVDLMSLTGEVRPESAVVTEFGSIQITWLGDGHVSSYERGWLRAHCYSEDARLSKRWRPVLWDASLGDDLSAVLYDDVMVSKASLLTWLRTLHDRGIAVIRSAPVQPREVTRIARRFSRVRETNFGKHFDVVAIPEPNSNAYTSMHVSCHSDLPNWTLPPGLQLLHCLKNNVDGGENMLVDGFLVAKKLRLRNRSAFDLLTRVPIKFRYQDAETDLVHRAPMISLDEDDEIVQVRFNRSVMEVLDVPSELMEDVYRAYLAFSALVRDPGIVARYRFVPGDVLVFNNWRVLHGRDSFDPSSGERHLQGCYAETDDMLSRIRVLERSP